MASEILSTIEGIFTIIGSASGLIALSYLAWSKYKRRVRIIPSKGISHYSDDKKSSLLSASAEITIHNSKDESISITDIVATLRYNEEKRKQKQYHGEVLFSEKPKEIDGLPRNVDPHKSEKIKLNFEFRNLDYLLIDRAPVAHFVGFLNGDVPLVISSEEEFEKYWEYHPIKMLISVHINGDKLIKTPILLLDARIKEEPQTGTLGTIDMARIEKDFWNEK